MAVLRGANTILPESGVFVIASANNQAVSSTSYTVVFQNTAINRESGLNVSSGIFTCPSAGNFRIEAIVDVAPTTGDSIYLRVEKNGSSVAVGKKETTGSSDVILNVWADLVLSVNDTVEIVLMSTLSPHTVQLSSRLSVIKYPG